MVIEIAQVIQDIAIIMILASVMFLLYIKIAIFPQDLNILIADDA